VGAAYRAGVNWVDMAVHPAFSMPLLTLLPFCIYYFDSLSAKALNLSRYVGFSWEAVFFGVLCSVAFVVAFFLVRDHSRKVPPVPDPVGARDPVRFFLLAAWGLVMLGLGVTVLTIFAEGPEYILKLWAALMAGQSAEAILYSPQGVMYSQNVPGVIRMWGACANSGVLVWLAAKPLVEYKARRAWYLNLVGLLALTFLRSMLAGDRSPAISALELAAYVIARDFYEVMRDPSSRAAIARRLPLVVGTALAGVAGYQVLGMMRGAKAQEYSTVLLYADLGMANLALAIRTGFGHTFGINSILGPIPNILRTFGLIIDWPVFRTEYIWSPPGNFLLVSFMDFGWFGWLNFAIMGAFAGRIWSRDAWLPGAFKWRIGRFYCIYVISTIFTAGIIAGVDFWAGVAGCAFVIWLWDRGSTHGPVVEIG